MSQPLYHFYHLFADGEFDVPASEHFTVLNNAGLINHLERVFVGLVGSPENRERAKELVLRICPQAEFCAESDSGWEQETLIPMWEFSQDHDGYASYGHSKGASRRDPIDTPWRRDMEFHNFVEWRHVINILDLGRYAVGAHRMKSPAANPDFGWGGMFAGNYWWVNMSILRQNCRPQTHSRFAAEHWIGQLSEVLPMTDETVWDLSPTPIQEEFLHSNW